MLTIPPLEKIISRSSKMRNTNAMTNSSSSVTSIGIETRADQNGGGIVYHPSDCGGGDSYVNVRFYGGGGATGYPGSICGQWVASVFASRIVWYANSPGNKNDNNFSGTGHKWSSYELNKDGGIRDIYKWNGWCDNYLYCKKSENQNPPTPRG